MVGKEYLKYLTIGILAWIFSMMGVYMWRIGFHNFGKAITILSFIIAFYCICKGSLFFLKEYKKNL